MPKLPFHGDPRHYETDITKLKAEIERLEWQLYLAGEQIKALSK